MTRRRLKSGPSAGLNRVRAFYAVDAMNDFGDFNGAINKSAIAVPGGSKIGPIIGALQLRGQETGFFPYQAEIRDAHKKGMFSFATNNRDYMKRGIHQVPDRDGILHTILPEHAIPGTWGWELLPGVRHDLFNAHFRKGEDLDKDQFSGATPEVIRWFQQRGVTDIYLVGLVRRICVGTTAINLVRNGFNVYLVSDATCDLDLPNWANVNDVMVKLGVQEISSQELLAQMKK